MQMKTEIILDMNFKFICTASWYAFSLFGAETNSLGRQEAANVSFS